MLFRSHSHTHTFLYSSQYETSSAPLAVSLPLVQCSGSALYHVSPRMLKPTWPHVSAAKHTCVCVGACVGVGVGVGVGGGGGMSVYVRVCVPVCLPVFACVYG